MEELKLINHPVHITGENEISAFIPFCFLCDNIDIIGNPLEGFEIPVCSLFHEKIYGGQICYEADVNQFRKNVGIKMFRKKGSRKNYVRTSE